MLVPLAIAIPLGIVLVAVGLMLGWSEGALGIGTICVGLLAMFLYEDVLVRGQRPPRTPR